MFDAPESPSNLASATLSDSIYPPRPIGVPEDLTKPSRSYKQRAWLAVAVLLGFLALYFALTGWFSWKAYRLFRGAFEGSIQGFVGIASGVAAAFFAVFLAKALLFVKRGQKEGLVELTAAQQPKLFAFLNRLADDAGAPRPRLVFVSSRVNAAVFYDLSLLSLVLPSKKNLEIGLGLVNVLTLGELKAVLAHEFGHFAQRAMAVGKWVYIGQQIAGHIVAKRDSLDSLLRVISGIDLRVAWIGWVMRLIVWSIRAVLDSAFRLVVLAERALSREMELQADLVAVSLTGSDALIHALHKLHAADEAWEQAVDFVAAERSRGRAVDDLFAIQSRVMQKTRGVLDDENWGQVPPMPAAAPHEHRVFKAELAQPPRMWSTHPPNREREDNTKKHYIRAQLSGRSAWDVFEDPQDLRARVTSNLLETIQKHAEDEAAAVEPVTVEESFAKLDEEYALAFLDPRYRGAYLGRSPVRHAGTIKELYAEAPTAGQDIVAALEALYPESLADELRRLRNLNEELAALEALHEGFLTAPGGVIRHRGRELRRKELPAVIEAVEQERARVRHLINDHDRACRTTHRAAAAHLGGEWEPYLVSLAALLHYASHSEADLGDARGHFLNVLSIVTADGRVSSAELIRLVAAAGEPHGVLWQLHAHRREVVLPARVAEILKVKQWPDALPANMDLEPPSRENMSSWVNVIDGWMNVFQGPFSALRSAALDALLEAEAHVATCTRDATDPGHAPTVAVVPTKYPTLTLGSERERQKKLDLWDRFQVADGLGPSLARFAVATSIVGAVIFAGTTVASRDLIIYNALDRAMEVQVDGSWTAVAPVSKTVVELPNVDRLRIESRVLGGPTVESFEVTVDSAYAKYVYSIAGASPLIEWYAAYGTIDPPPERNRGPSRWLGTDSDILFAEPPKQISTRGGGGTKTVLSGFGDRPVMNVLNLISKDEDRETVALAHARWDSIASPKTWEWLVYASGAEGFAPVLQARLAEEPTSVGLMRLEQDVAEGEARKAVCERHSAMAKADSANLGLRYLAIRCLDDGAERDQAFMRENRAAPNEPWFAMAAGMTAAHRGQWAEALPNLALARSKLASAQAYLGVAEARVRRAKTADSTARLDDLVRVCYPLERHVMLERPNPELGPFVAYAHLRSGELDKALDMCAGEPRLRERVLRFAAASEGASQEQIARALALNEEAGIDPATVWSTVALAKRLGRDCSAYEKKVRELAPDAADTMLLFADAQRLKSDLAAAEAALAHVGALELRGHACVMATIVLGPETPQHWRQQAKTLLFADERPYLQ